MCESQKLNKPSIFILENHSVINVDKILKRTLVILPATRVSEISILIYCRSVWQLSWWSVFLKQTASVGYNSNRMHQSPLQPVTAIPPSRIPNQTIKTMEMYHFYIWPRFEIWWILQFNSNRCIHTKRTQNLYLMFAVAECEWCQKNHQYRSTSDAIFAFAFAWCE